MSAYIRTTRECPVNQLRPELFLAVRNYFLEHGLGDVETESLLCYETTSKRKEKSKLFAWLNAGLDETVHVGMLFTPRWLVWVWSGDRSGLHVSVAELMQISVKVYSSIWTKEVGLEIAGHIEGTKGIMRGVVAMESLSAAEKFCDEVTQAIVKVRPPVENPISRWWGGTK